MEDDEIFTTYGEDKALTEEEFKMELYSKYNFDDENDNGIGDDESKAEAEDEDSGSKLLKEKVTEEDIRLSLS